MDLFLLNNRKFCQANPEYFGEVTNPILLDKGNSPTPDGLLSTFIFGNTSKERSCKFGFIDLNGHYFQPHVYKVIKKIDRRIDAIISGRIKVIIDKEGKFVEDENGSTGMEFIYANWAKIKFDKNNSLIRNERIDLINSHKKDEIFTDVCIVSPAMYRDINLQDTDSGKVSYHEINTMYAKVLRLVSMLKQDVSLSVVLHNTKYTIQSALVEIYNYYKEKIEKKNGIIRKSLLGKSIDYGSRLVISAPVYNTETHKEMGVDFYHAGIPLANCCSLFTPAILAWVRNFLQRELEYSAAKYPFIEKEYPSFKPLKDPMSYYNDTTIKKMMDKFIYSYSDRYDKIKIPTDNMEKDPYYMYFTGYDYEKTGEKHEPLGKQYMTLTDLFYMAAYDVCKDKYVYITRYPLTDYLGVFPSGIHVLSTHTTRKIIVGETTYEHYPVVDLSKSKDEVSVAFIDVVRMSNVYLKVLGGDYDGDQISVKGCFSQNSNLEAEKILKSKKNILGISGNNLRITTNETIQTLYMMTKFDE